jgi:hypothetical protein
MNSALSPCGDKPMGQVVIKVQGLRTGSLHGGYDDGLRGKCCTHTCEFDLVGRGHLLGDGHGLRLRHLPNVFAHQGMGVVVAQVTGNSDLEYPTLTRLFPGEVSVFRQRSSPTRHATSSRHVQPVFSVLLAKGVAIGTENSPRFTKNFVI